MTGGYLTGWIVSGLIGSGAAWSLGEHWGWRLWLVVGLGVLGWIVAGWGMAALYVIDEARTAAAACPSGWLRSGLHCWEPAP